MKIGQYQNTHIRNNVASFLEEHAKNRPNKTVFHYIRAGKQTKISYRQMNEQSSRLAQGLVNQGILKGDRVMICLKISLELYLAIAALQRIGAIPVLIDSSNGAMELSAIFENAKPKGIISSAAIIGALSALLNTNNIDLIISIDTCKGSIQFDELKKNIRRPIVALDKGDTALITYTTGSSGKPKGANRTHHFLAAQHYALKRLFPYKNSDIDLPVFPVFTLNNIASGITTVLPGIDISSPTHGDSEILISQIRKFNVNCMTLAPSSFRNLANHCLAKGIKLRGMKRILTGGAPISEKEIRFFTTISPDSKNFILYGSTEVEPISYIESGKVLVPTAGDTSYKRNPGVNVGKIDKALQCRFIHIHSGFIASGVNIDSLSVRKGSIGELIVIGEHVCREYFENPEAFLRAKIQDDKGNIWHRTGDLGYLDRNGYLWIVGRVHNVIIHRDKYYFPVRPEIILKDLQGVTNAAYLRAELKGKDKIVAVISGDIEFFEQCKKTIFKVFAKEKLPIDDIVFMDVIPMDIRHHSKIEYNLLRQKIHEISQ